MMRFLSLLLLGQCPCVVSVAMWSSVCGRGTLCGCNVTVMCVLLFTWCVCMLRGYEGDGNAGVGEGAVGVVSVGHVGGTRGLGIVSSVADVLEMDVVRGMRGVGGVCEIFMCLARGGVGGMGVEWMRGFGLGFTNPVGTGGLLNVCLCLGCGGVGGVGGEWVVGLDKGLEGWGGVMAV